MSSSKWACLLALALLPASASPAVAEDATMLRVFLTDGTSLVSYGEPARVGDRIIFSMPTAATPNPPLHLVNLASARVDWARTDRYATAAREARYLESQASVDYAALANRASQALKDVAQPGDTAKRLAVALDVRKWLAAWPQEHYNYRQADVRQMVSLLDEAIVDLRAAMGERRFDIALSAYTEPRPVVREALLPSPTPKEIIEQVLTAARLVDTATERRALLADALAGFTRDAPALPAGWVTPVRNETQARFDAEVRVDNIYRSMTERTMTLAKERARVADVRGLERLVEESRHRDELLGGQRPDTVSALVAALQAQLDAARRLRLAQDQWALRAETYRQYELAIATPLRTFAALKAPLENIKSLAGNSPYSLSLIQTRVAKVLKDAKAITPPEELRAAHALLVSAAQLAANAAQIRRQASLAGDIARAWDASSAAAGALMLGTRARTDIQTLLRPPQLR